MSVSSESSKGSVSTHSSMPPLVDCTIKTNIQRKLVGTRTWFNVDNTLMGRIRLFVYKYNQKTGRLCYGASIFHIDDEELSKKDQEVTAKWDKMKWEAFALGFVTSPGDNRLFEASKDESIYEKLHSTAIDRFLKYPVIVELRPGLSDDNVLKSLVPLCFRYGVAARRYLREYHRWSTLPIPNMIRPLLMTKAEAKHNPKEFAKQVKAQIRDEMHFIFSKDQVAGAIGFAGLLAMELMSLRSKKRE